MVEASPAQQTSNGTTSSEQRNQTTPESEKPRVQLLLQSKTTSPPVTTKLLTTQQPDNEEQKNLALLKQTVAQLEESHDGGENATATATSSTAGGAKIDTDAASAEQDTLRHKEEAQTIETMYQEILSKVSELQKGNGHAAEMSFEQRADALNAIFLNKMQPLQKRINTATIEAQVEEQLYYQQTLEYQNRGTKADIIRQKYEQITREYNAQNSQFQERHIAIKNDEQAKRQEILKNFDDHLSTIRSQMAEDVAKSKEENELIQKETADLEVKYEELQKECTEKMELMTTQLGEQDGKQSGIEDTLTTQIDTQATELKKQVEAYKEQTKVKVEEEKQLLNVLKEYKAKYQEFQQATKFSKQNHKKFAKEIQALGHRKKKLETDYGNLCMELDILGEPDTVSERIEAKVSELSTLEAEWETEKAELLAQAEAVKEECSQMQLQIKQQKEAAQAAAAAAAQ